MTQMSIVEPPTAPDPVTTVVPEQRDAVIEKPTPAIDHVRRHASSCYWDFREARWQCAR